MKPITEFEMLLVELSGLFRGLQIAKIDTKGLKHMVVGLNELLKDTLIKYHEESGK